jgi:hypothetical protein
MLTVALLLSAPGIASAQLYDAAADFSLSSNPNGAWRYGFSETLGSAFLLDTANKSDPAGIVDAWLGNRWQDGNPVVSHNRTNTTVALSTVVWQPYQLIQHPGPSGEISVLRWTAPTSGQYRIDAGFIGQDVVGTTTDVHVLLNDVSLFDGAVDGYQNATSFTSTRILSAGDRVDFAVGVGSDGSFGFDSTGVSARLTAVPAPAAVSGTITLKGCQNSVQTITFTFRPADGSDDIIKTATLAADGSFQFHLPKKNYTLHVKGS